MAQGNSSYGSARRLGAAKAHEFQLVYQYKLGYRNREDVTNLPPGVLIVGSKNVMTNVSERVQIRQGYSLDGATSSVAAPVANSFDWQSKFNGEIHVRVGGLTSAGNDGKLQFRFVNDDATPAVSWEDITIGLTTTAYNFTTFWNVTENLREMLYVNGTPNIFAWNGASAEVLSSDNTAGHIVVLNATPTNAGTGYVVGDVLTITTGGTGGTATVTTIGGSGAITAVTLTTSGSGYTTGTGKATSGGTGTGATLNITTVATGKITIAGTTTIANKGFYLLSNLVLTNAGTNYTYSHVIGTSFYGISPSPASIVADSVIIQTPVTTANTSLTGVPATFPNGLISTLNNQLFLGALTSPAVYISKVDDYTNYSFSTPRQTGEGGVLTLDANCVAFLPQEQYMYISAGLNLWYNVSFSLQTSTVGVTYEQVNALLLKTGRQQGAMSQAFVSHMKNNIILATNETTVDIFGRLENYFATPQTKNISDSIKLDIDTYDFTDGSIFYWRYYILVAIPKNNIVIMYNLSNNSWESPQGLPISRFYIVDGELYGHSYSTFESYKLFTGYADRAYPGFLGFPIPAVMNFSYQNYGTRSALKKATSLYIEGYINPNTTINTVLSYETGGCETQKGFTVDGDDAQIVCLVGNRGSLGKLPLGKQKLGGELTTTFGGVTLTSALTDLPPKFRVEKTFSNTDFFECNLNFSCLGTNQRFELLAFGLNASISSEIPVYIRQ